MTEVDPIKVHLESSSVSLTKPRDKVRTEYSTETCQDGNTVQPVLSDNPDRVCAYIQVTGGDVYICNSEAHAKASTPQGMILPSANTAPWPIYGQNAVWAVQVTGGKTCVISVAADYSTYDEGK